MDACGGSLRQRTRETVESSSSGSVAVAPPDAMPGAWAAAHARELHEELEKLLVEYRAVTRVSFALPSVSLFPYCFLLWRYVRFYICIFLEPVLIVINAPIQATRLFGRRPRYRSLIWRDVKTAARWLWRGESPIPPSVVLRWPVTTMVSRHICRRLLLTRRLLALDDGLGDEDRERLVARIDKALPLWQQRGLFAQAYTALLALGGISTLAPAAHALRKHGPLSIPAIAWLILGLFCLLPIVPGLFGVKRGLMLGGRGRDAYFPGCVPSRNVYDIEDRMLRLIDLRRREFPADLVWSLVYPAFFTVVAVGLATEGDAGGAIVYSVFAAVYLLFTAFLIWRRAVSGRC
jgi:hypothetical protein